MAKAVREQAGTYRKPACEPMNTQVLKRHSGRANSHADFQVYALQMTD
jgi:hypothetical protein